MTRRCRTIAHRRRRSVESPVAVCPPDTQGSFFGSYPLAQCSNEKMDEGRRYADTTLPKQEVPTGLRIAGIVLRSVFLCTLLVLTVRVSLPQNESILSVYETLGDLVRVALGFIVCVLDLIPPLHASQGCQRAQRCEMRLFPLSATVRDGRPGDLPIIFLFSRRRTKALRCPL